MKRTLLKTALLFASLIALANSAFAQTQGSIKATPFYTNIYSNNSKTAFSFGGAVQFHSTRNGMQLGSNVGYARLSSNFDQASGCADIVGFSGFAKNENFQICSFTLCGMSDAFAFKAGKYNIGLTGQNLFCFGISPSAKLGEVSLFSSYIRLTTGGEPGTLHLIKGTPQIKDFSYLSYGFKVGPLSMEAISCQLSAAINNKRDEAFAKLNTSFSGLKLAGEFKFNRFLIHPVAGVFDFNLAGNGSLADANGVFVTTFKSATGEASGTGSAALAGLDCSILFSHSKFQVSTYFACVFDAQGTCDVNWQFQTLYVLFHPSVLPKGSTFYQIKLKMGSLILVNLNYHYTAGPFELGVLKPIIIPTTQNTTVSGGSTIITPSIDLNTIAANAVPLLLSGLTVYVSFTK